MDFVIDIRDLKKNYKKRKSNEIIEAVKGISLQVKKGEVVGLLGPNGAGKTTTIKMMCGLLLPNEGTVKINGIDMTKQRLKALRHISAVLEGNRNLYWRLTVRENMEYFSGNRGMSKKEISKRIDELLERLNLTHKANELVNSLSRGMQQKLSIAVAILSNTEIIFLDEPTLGLDVEISYEIRNLLKEIAKEYNKTILLSSHDMPVVQEINLFWFLAMSVMQGIGWSIMNEAQLGTLEQMYMSPMGAWRILLARIISSTIIQLIMIVILLYLSMLTTNTWLNIDVISILPVLIFTLISMMGVSFMIAGLAIIFKQIGSFLQIFQFILMGLTFAPLSSVPYLVVFPVVKGVDMARGIMIHNQTLTDFSMGDYTSLIVNAMIYLLAGIAVFKRCEQTAMIKGVLGQH